MKGRVDNAGRALIESTLRKSAEREARGLACFSADPYVGKRARTLLSLASVMDDSERMA